MVEMVWDWKSITSLLATIVFIRSAARDFVPPELRHLVSTLFSRFLAFLRPISTLLIDEFDPSGSSNDLFHAVHTYLSSRCLAATAPTLRLSKTKNSKDVTFSLPSSHSTTDVFEGVDMKWWYHSVERGGSGNGGRGGYKGSRSSGEEQYGYFELSFNNRYRDMVHHRYVPFIVEEAASLKLKARERRLYTNQPFGGKYGSDWSSVPFNHPATFDTLAIDLALKDSIKDDLLRFSARREYFSRVGRPWKRGYLLYGPPGTGKTSLIAAIANFLEFDLYDLELTAVLSNTQLRKLLISTSTKSVIVVEDVDCSLDLSDRKKSFKKQDQTHNNNNNNSNNNNNNDSEGTGANGLSFSSVSLSGVLNFVDGLWSSCVGERLMIFTTNHPERLDPALLRPGRMDRKIHLSYCEAPAFKLLAKNYLQLEEEHELMGEVEGLLKEVKVTPADIAEVFMACDGDGADVGMTRVVDELRKRKEEKKLLLLPEKIEEPGPTKEEETWDSHN